jgi:1,2-diacylglycerol 3-beta-galactosyltransferase
LTDIRNILILTSDAGLGHRSAAEAIAAALVDSHGDECTVAVVNPAEDEQAPGFLRSSEEDYDRIVQEMPDLYKFGYRVSDTAVPASVIESALTVILFGVMRDLLRRYEPHAIISTYPLYQAPLEAVFTIEEERRVPLITVITDLVENHRLWFSPNSDLCLVPTEEARDLALSYGLALEKIEVTGIPVDPTIAEEARELAEIRAELGWRIDLPTLLVVGGKRVGNLMPALHALNHSGLALQLALVAGGDDALYHQFQETDWHTVAHIYNFVGNMPTLMRASDFVLCKAGGLIVSEALASGLPLVLIDVLPGQETGNAEYVIEHGAGEKADDALAALEMVHHWLDDGGALLFERAQNARRLGRPRAAFEIAKHVWKIVTETGEERRDTSSRRPVLIDLLDRHGVLWRECRSSWCV